MGSDAKLDWLHNAKDMRRIGSRSQYSPLLLASPKHKFAEEQSHFRHDERESNFGSPHTKDDPFIRLSVRYFVNTGEI
jgi:hypothetical protein